ncbi:hypothetical protein ACHAWF_007178 [Thalassiosira exigua]
MIGSDRGDVIIIDSDDDSDSGVLSPGPIEVTGPPRTAAHREVDQSVEYGPPPEQRSIPYANAWSDNNEEKSSSSSSSSSGIPSPAWKAKVASSSSDGNRPPSIICTNKMAAEEWQKSPTVKPAKKKCLTNSNRTVSLEEASCTDTSTISSISKVKGCARTKKASQPVPAKNQSKETKGKVPTKQRKKRQWGQKKKNVAKSTDSACGDSSATSAAHEKAAAAKDGASAAKHFHCYLLRSLDPDHPLKTYIGFTTHPQRRIRQHNGLLKNAGARRTKRSGRPWTFVCVIHGFQDKITALQFEWAWQNVDKSLAFRETVGCDQLAKKMKRRLGPKARLDELRILLKECLPFCLYSLTIFFPEREYYDIYRGILKRGADGNPYKKNDGESEAYEPLTNIELCSLENMPAAREAAELKDKRKAKREEQKAQKKKDKVTDYRSDVSDWLENAKSVYEKESCWSDMLGDGDDSNCDNLKSIQENDSSVILCDGTAKGEKHSAGHSKEVLHDDEDGSVHSINVDDVSKDFFSLSIDAPEKRSLKEPEECDFSTISSADNDDSSGCSLDDENVAPAYNNNAKGTEKDIDHTKSGGTNCDIVDLCDSF